MKKIIILIVLATLTFATASAQQPDAQYRLLRYRYTVNADGTTDYNVRKELRFIRNRAITAYADKGETFIVYDPQYETLTINESYTLLPNGTRVATPANAYVEQLPSTCTDCGRFNHIRELAIIHTALEYDAVVVLDYTIHRSSDLILGSIQLPQDCPVDRMEVEITMPDKYELTATLSTSPYMNFATTVKQTHNSYNLTANNIPQTFVGAYLPAATTLYPTLTFRNGTPQYKPNFDLETLPQGTETITSLTSNNPTTTVKNLRDYVASNIHLNDLPADLVGYTHSTAIQTWQTGCGTRTDRAVLLAAMLRTAGFDARVYGPDYTQVAVTIDTMEYDATPAAKSAPLSIIGEAHDLVNTITVRQSGVATLDTLEGGYYAYTIATDKRSTLPHLSMLSPSRTAPVALQPCYETYTYTVTLPKGLKMIRPTIKEQKTVDGLGSVSVSIKQSGRKLKIERHMNIDKEIVVAADYASLRQLLAMWEAGRQIILKQ